MYPHTRHLGTVVGTRVPTRVHACSSLGVVNSFQQSLGIWGIWNMARDPSEYGIWKMAMIPRNMEYGPDPPRRYAASIFPIFPIFPIFLLCAIILCPYQTHRCVSARLAQARFTSSCHGAAAESVRGLRQGHTPGRSRCPGGAATSQPSIRIRYSERDAPLERLHAGVELVN